MTRVLVIPAAGAGSRLGSAGPKVLHPVAGRPMLDYLLDLYGPFVDRIVVVASPEASALVRAHGAGRPEFIEVDEQAAPTGMLDAILVPEPRLRTRRADHVWITWCDQVGLLPRTVARVRQAARRRPEAALIMPTSLGRDPYIHLDRDGAGTITRIRHRREGDEMPATGESDAGLFVLSGEAYHGSLVAFAAAAGSGARTGERNFLPFIPWIAARAPVVTVPCEDPREAVGINTPDDQRAIEAWLRTRETWEAAGDGDA